MYAQDIGCLPSKTEIIKLKDETENNWACHSNNKRICQGLAEHRDVTTGGLHLEPCVNADWVSWKEEDLKPIIKENPLRRR